MTYLILRFSTVGSVAMLVPVLESASRRQPDDRFVVVSKKRLSSMFAAMPNVDFITADHEDSTHQHNTQKSIAQLYRQITDRYHIDAVLDMQNSVQSRLLRLRFRLSGKRVYVIREQLLSQWRLRLKGYRRSQPLETETERYSKVFTKAGLVTDDAFRQIAVDVKAAAAVRTMFGSKTGRWIGVAPFAKKKSNMLPYRTTKQLIRRLAAMPDTQVFLFGAGEVECEMLRLWASLTPNTTCVAGILPLEQELELMRQLDLIVCMDSANQHFASIVGLRAVSIWCATHPYTGYYGYRQSDDDCLQRPLSCRPCTNHGRTQCPYRNFLCRQITVEQILEKITNNKYTNK